MSDVETVEGLIVERAQLREKLFELELHLTKAREEQREADAHCVEYSDLGLFGTQEDAGLEARNHIAATIRATALTSTPLTDRIKELEDAQQSILEMPCESPACETTLGDVLNAPTGDELSNEHSPIWFCGNCWNRGIHLARAYAREDQRELCARAAEDRSSFRGAISSSAATEVAKHVRMASLKETPLANKVRLLEHTLWQIVQAYNTAGHANLSNLIATVETDILSSTALA